MNSVIQIAPSARMFGPKACAREPARALRTAISARRFRRRVLLLVGGCALPPAVLLAMGKLTLAANSFWGAFALLTVFLVAARRHETLLALLLGVMPLINLLRGLGIAFYNVTLIVLPVVLFFYAIRSPHVFVSVYRRCRLVMGLFAFAVVYYALSFWMTGDYTRNLRLLEFCFAAFAVLLAGHNRYVLRAALLGMTVSACTVGIGLLPQNDFIGRLGIALLEDIVVGNPVQLGLVLALGFLALTVDRGQWLALTRGEFWKWILLIPTTILLVLTTSRVSWLVAGAGLTLAILLGRRQRLRMLVVFGLVALVTAAALASPFGPALRIGLNRTFNDELNLGRRTSGRSDQWAVAFQTATASWDRLLWGYGPGQGPAVYARYSDEVAGVHYAVGQEAELHSLFMQVWVETGLIGLVTNLGWLLLVFTRVVAGARASHRLLPLVCFCAYVIAITTISGNDTACGMILGIALLGVTNHGLV